MGPRALQLGHAALVASIVIAAPPAAMAQGAGEGHQFGAWLDDASAPVAGEGQMTIAAGRWSMPGVSQTNMPILASGFAVSDRLQLIATLPFYRVTVDGTTASGIDSTYLGAKYNIIDPTISLSEIGLSVGSIVEVLSAGTTEGRVHFVVPVSVELRRAPFRGYASAGYFSRGAVYTGAALEWTGPRGLSLTGSMTTSQSVHANPALDELEVPRRRVDLSGGVAYPLGRQVAAFVNLGRGIGGATSGANPLVVNGGLSFWFRTRAVLP